MRVATDVMISFLENENVSREVGCRETYYTLETASGDIVVTLFGNGMEDVEFLLSDEDFEFLDI